MKAIGIDVWGSALCVSMYRRIRINRTSAESNYLSVIDLNDVRLAFKY